MELERLTLDQLNGLAAALEYEPRSPGGLVDAIGQFGITRPIVINRLSHRVLNPLDLAALNQAAAAGVALPDAIPCLFLESNPVTDSALSLIVTGGLDGWLCGIPRRVSDVLEMLYSLTPEQMTALGPPVDYFLDVLDGDPPPATAPEGRMVAAAPLPDNDYQMPKLDPARQITGPPPHWTLWGSQGRSTPAAAVHFYTDDSRFQSLINYPEQLQAARTQNVIELNTSTGPETPAGLAIGDMWRKRKLSQTWQGYGINVAVDLNVNRRFFDLALQGVPTGWRAYANRAYADDLGHLHEAHARACTRARSDEILYFVYGGQAARQLCQAKGWHYIPMRVKDGTA